MSYYTNIHPDLSRFNIREDMTVEELKALMDEKHVKTTAIKKMMDDLWVKITGYAVATPLNDNYDTLMKKVDGLVDDYIYGKTQEIWNNFTVELCDGMSHNILWLATSPENDWEDTGNGKDVYGRTHEEFLEDFERDKLSMIPSISWNHFEYANDPQEGTRDIQSYIDTIKQKLVAMSVATPKDIVQDSNDILSALINEINSLREWLDTCVAEITFCELMIDYQDTITWD